MKVITPASTRALRLVLLATALLLVAGGFAVQRVGLASPTTTSTAAPVTTTTRAGVPTTTPVTTTTLYAPGVVVASSGPRRASHCPLNLAAMPAGKGASLTLRPRECTVLEIGDSLGNDLGWGLQRELNYPWLHLVQEDKSSSGLANAWFYNWPAHLATYLHQYHPDIVLVMLGGNDQQSYYVRGVYENVGSASWRATYRHYVTQVIDMARGAGAQVLWVGLPVMQPAFYSQGAAMLDAQYAAAVAHSHNAAYLPTWHLFSTPSGTFRASAPVNGSVQGLRSSDGIHFSAIGEDLLSTYVVDQMGRLFHLPLRASQPAHITAG